MEELSQLYMYSFLSENYQRYCCIKFLHIMYPKKNSP